MSDTQNPLLTNTYIVEFEKVEPQHVEPAVTQLIEETEKTIEVLESVEKATWDSVMSPLNKLEIDYQRAFSPVPHLLSVRNSEELREVYEKVQPSIVEASLKLAQNEKIFEHFSEIKEGDQWSSLDNTQKRIVESKILDAKLSGIALKGEEKKRFNEISQQLSQLTTKFSNNVLDATKAFEKIIEDKSLLAGVSDSFFELASNSYKQAHKKDSTPANGPWRITLDYPMLEPIMRDCENRDLRREFYLANVKKASEGEFDNSELMLQILRLRKEKANLLGYENFGELSTSDKMAGNVKSVTQLLEELFTASYEYGKKEIKELVDFAKQNGHEGDFEQWDLRFWSEKQRQQKFEFSSEEVRAYFPLDTVLTGMFDLVTKIFGIEARESNGEAPVWHKDVKFFKLYNEKNEHVASFHFDPYSRPENKRAGAWMNECVVKYENNGSVVVPVAYIVCNFSPATESKPSLLTFRDVETIFHEFGHALQHMLTHITEPEASGINGIEWDAVELPSQFMENWCYHKPTIKSLSRHFETGEQLPDALFEKIKSAKNFQSALGMLRQLLFGRIDMELHTNFDTSKSSQDIFTCYDKVARETLAFEPHPEDRFLCHFTHIFAGGYAAGYYSYKWAEVLSADAFSAFEEVGLENEQKVMETGRRFRETILGLGGSMHPMEVFKKFRGREPSTKPLLQHSGLLA